MATENYIYLLRTREFVTANKNVYKIGRTNQTHTNRFKQYPKGSELILQYSCNDCIACEKGLLYIFRVNYIKRKDIGSEYFEGDVVGMKRDIHNFIDNEEVSIINTNELINEEKIQKQLEKRDEKEELAKQAKLELEKQLELEKDVKLKIQEQLENQKELEKEVKLKIQKQLESDKQKELEKQKNQKNQDKIKKRLEILKQTEIKQLNSLKLQQQKEIEKQKKLKNIDLKLKENHICKRCSIDFEEKKRLVQHLKRKRWCIAIENDIDPNIQLEALVHKNGIECVKCNKIYSSKDSLRRHRCSNVTPQDTINELKYKIKVLETKNNKNETQYKIEELQNNLLELKKLL
jgi:hypothetical protein